MARVYIGVGHGGSDPGAVANGFNEKDLNLSISKAVQDVLTRHGVSVKISRTKDQDKDLVYRIKECNAFNPDLALDIHNNAGGGDGAEVYYYSGGGKSKTLASNILSEMVEIGQNSRGLKTKKDSNGLDYFGFIREINAPSVIVECAFVDNKTDLKIIDTAAEQKAMGVAIAKGILKTLGIAYKEQQTSASKPKPSPQPAKDKAPDVVYRVRCGGKWLPEVKNLTDFAGIAGEPVTDVAVRVTDGTVKYRVHVKGSGWLPYVTGCNIKDAVNGYAGNGKEIDAIEVYYFTPKGKAVRKAKYRVSPLKGGYWPWQYDDEKTGGQDGYAGAFGRSMDRLQIVIV